MTSSLHPLPSSCPSRCLAGCTKPFSWLYLQLHTIEVILYKNVSYISPKYTKKITHSVSHPISLHLIISFDSNFKESTTSPHRHPFKVLSTCLLGICLHFDRPVSSTIEPFSVLVGRVSSTTPAVTVESGTTSSVDKLAAEVALEI